MSLIAIIGGSGLTNLNDFEITRRELARTPYGEPSATMVYGELHGQSVVFLPRHGPAHTIPPHEINYRANIWALKDAGAEKIIAIAAVGAISNIDDGSLVIPDQIIDYTYGRQHTFFGTEAKQVTHVDFTEPYCEQLRQVLIAAAKKAAILVTDGAVYGATQGPRFETRAEINRMASDGVDLVGMTGMPEASLACELDLCYSTIAVIANAAAGKGKGKGKGQITINNIEKNIASGMLKVRRLLEAAVALPS